LARACAGDCEGSPQRVPDEVVDVGVVEASKGYGGLPEVRAEELGH